MSVFPRTQSEGLLSGLPRISLAFAAVGAIARNIANRRAAMQVAELPDYLLTDIGLKRDDVHEVLTSDWHDDPTYLLAIKAAGHRRAK